MNHSLLGRHAQLHIKRATGNFEGSKTSSWNDQRKITSEIVISKPNKFLASRKINLKSNLPKSVNLLLGR